MTNEKLDTMRHSASHVMAAAVKALFKDVKFAIGPTIAEGFYYDFDLGKNTFNEEDLAKIEAKMQEIVKADLEIKREELSIKDALARVKGQTYKEELIKDLEKESETKVSFYSIGDIFDDLCRGPHVKSTKEVGPFKLLRISGAYWRGDEKNKMLQRIYGTAFEAQKELDEYLKMLVEAEKRDHRKIGKELDLFTFSDLVGPGLPLYTFRGAIVRNQILNLSKELRAKIGYQEVHTPQINKAELFKISGHYDKFKEDMFRVISNYTEEEFFLKPMNCPQHTQIFAAVPRSYKDLPIRIADCANLYRDERPGELSGLTRLRAFSQDDSHCFCREDHIKDEFSNMLGAIETFLKIFDLSYYIRLSLRDEANKDKYLGDDKVWQKSQKFLEELLREKNLEYIRKEGEAAFYGPKMDIIARDALGREWQISTIQLDFNMPVRFKLEYTGADGKKYTPIMIHGALAGSPERFMALLIEHYAGAFPTWMAPVQVKILPVSDKFIEYALEVKNNLIDNNIRVEIDDSAESLGKKIRAGEQEKVPYLLIIGEKEVNAKQVAVRQRGKGDLGPQDLAKFAVQIKDEILNRK
ncbi:MAG: threonine--tRNA ligase [Candidatus Parcubacteria bacterium]|nr:threonine--tRNA ligase [Candidatus Parcubacteria bacterium]